MPGTNPYSMYPGIMDSEYDTPSQPKSTRPKVTLLPKKESLTEEATTKNTAGIGVKPPKLGDPYTNLPELYKTKTYDPSTFDENAFAEDWFRKDYGDKASKKDMKTFNKFKTSEEYINALAAAKEKARNEFIKAEQQKWSDSYTARLQASSDQV